MLALQPRVSFGQHRAAGRVSSSTRSVTHICSATRQRVGSSNTSRNSDQQRQHVADAAAASTTFATSFGLYLLAAAPAVADVADAGSTPFQGVTANSLYVTLALFLMTAPGKQTQGIVWGSGIHSLAAAVAAILQCAQVSLKLPCAINMVCNIPC